MSRTLPIMLLAGTLLATMAIPSAATATDPAARGKPPQAEPKPLVIAHRGASGYRPEHTLEAYRLAIRQGADYIEPDLVSTADGVLVARHENEISGTTDVADRAEFADRRATKTIDGRSVTGWFTEDFTLAELRTLRAVERLPQVRPTNTAFDGEFTVPTLQEVIDLARSEGRRLGRTIGIYPETKHPTYFQSIGLPLEEPLVDTLRRNKLTRRTDAVFIQSFETANLRKLSRMTNVRLVQLLGGSGRPYDFVVAGDPRGYADLATPDGLAWISRYADAIGPTKDLIVPRDADGALLAPTSLIRDAHRARLAVHAWTFRAENQFLPADHRIGADPAARGDITAEYELFYGLGLDGLFADHPDTAVAVRVATR
ncbi:MULTISPECIES: glycerophosphodiester phosphodiesterase [unclassified Solwaraspora]|uniref:glycerophosphodiester phosphodiesterase n=1 Tax=unclassified Solwaraspora TaxID=2627926 RepID=UPI00248BBFA6|nr:MULTISPECIES: glycerophosphodiester phosphodiesterase [unclassified Solwaraspora]WBB96420.1 glycerophosphodiester phosphodiesterase [Solwaraspora sp. WMMA2059]WBC19673.1 glycerophosphodiester phosphodiesterase [Solwaraspora sp. WMMA2080]WJK32746.1 glycerophosphodiester phosphodiesterase [Solwaraspora sp. WMMA2065]